MGDNQMWFEQTFADCMIACQGNRGDALVLSWLRKNLPGGSGNVRRTEASSALFGVSTEAIRNSINSLEKRGLIHKTCKNGAPLFVTILPIMEEISKEVDRQIGNGKVNWNALQVTANNILLTQTVVNSTRSTVVNSTRHRVEINTPPCGNQHATVVNSTRIEERRTKKNLEEPLTFVNNVEKLIKVAGHGQGSLIADQDCGLGSEVDNGGEVGYDDSMGLTTSRRIARLLVSVPESKKATSLLGKSDKSIDGLILDAVSNLERQYEVEVITSAASAAIKDTLSSGIKVDPRGIVRSIPDYISLADQIAPVLECENEPETSNSESHAVTDVQGQQIEPASSQAAKNTTPVSASQFVDAEGNLTPRMRKIKTRKGMLRDELSQHYRRTGQLDLAEMVRKHYVDSFRLSEFLPVLKAAKAVDKWITFDDFEFYDGITPAEDEFFYSEDSRKYVEEARKNG